MERDIATIARKRVRLAAFLPVLLSVALIAADQVSKSWIVTNVPINTIASRYMGDFLWIVHARNLGIAFSIGDSISRLLRILLFIIMPAGFIAGAVVFGIVSKKISLLQRYAISMIIAGGVGNLIDRIFRPDGVVDFISFSLFGILGLDRFPTFNIADFSITIGASILLISGFLMEEKDVRDDKR